ncbi:MAG: hypothetical protein F4X94_10740 [Dehalococcoidia bacterium]|nr:hypothetical protein [Dehalococcoidia bacterium]
MPATALVSLLHHDLSRVAGTTVALSDIEEHDFWRLLGIFDMSVVRYVLSCAATKGIIAYERNGDGPECITTLMGHSELIDTRFSLD